MSYLLSTVMLIFLFSFWHLRNMINHPRSHWQGCIHSTINTLPTIIINYIHRGIDELNKPVLKWNDSILSAEYRPTNLSRVWRQCEAQMLYETSFLDKPPLQSCNKKLERGKFNQLFLLNKLYKMRSEPLYVTKLNWKISHVTHWIFLHVFIPKVEK